MYRITNILDEYKRLRTHGLEIPEAIKALESHIEQLSQTERRALSQQLRSWEHVGRAASASEPSLTLNIGELDKATFDDDDDILVCPHCEEPNLSSETVCRACGKALQAETSKKGSTALLPDLPDEIANDAYFGRDSLMMLLADDDPQPIVLRPPLAEHDLTVGRISGNTIPDVDLGHLQAGNLGVSRLHAAIGYDPVNHTVHLMDLASTNGTHLNGHRLHMNERRVVRDNDTLKLGKLQLKVHFQHS